MLLRGVLEPVNPQERVVYQNLQVLVEVATIQQAEHSTSRLRHVPSLPTGGVGTRQMDRSIHLPLQPPSAAREAMVTPWPDLAPALL